MLNNQTQIETLTLHLKKSVSEYCNKNNITEEEDIESYNKKAEEFVVNLKWAIQNDSKDHTYGFNSKMDAKEAKKRREELEGIVFYGDINTVNQILISGKKHQEYYGIHLSDLEELTIQYLNEYSFLQSKYIDGFILRIYMYYHAVTYGEIIKEDTLSISNLSMYHYAKGGSIKIGLFKWFKEIAYALIFFGVPTYITVEAYFYNWNNFPAYLTLTSVWLLIFFPRYIINLVAKNKEDNIKTLKWTAYNNLWIAVSRSPYALRNIKKTIEDLTSHKNIIFENTFLMFLDKMIEKHGSFLDFSKQKLNPLND